MEIKNSNPEQKKIAVLLDDLVSLENYARDLLSFIPLPVCSVSIIGIILDANPALEKISGYSTEEVIGNPLEKFINKLDFKRLAKETLEKGSLSSYEIILTTKDKKKIPVSASTLLRKNEKEETVGFFFSFYDLTSVKENEQWLRRSQAALLNMIEDVKEEKSKTASVIAHLTDGLMVFDSQNNLSLINSSAKRFLSVKNNELYNKSPAELAVLVNNFRPLFEILGEEIKEIFRKEIIIEGFTLEVTSSLMGLSKERGGSLVIMHDITREKAIEKMKTEFVSIAAHQLRTPLSAIKWALSLLLEGDVGELSPEQKSVINKSYASNERMIRLVSDLLDVARIEEGRYVYKLELGQFESLVGDSVRLLKELAKKRNIKLEFEEPKDSLPKIMMDTEKITIAVQNLIENAIKYTPIGGEVIISLKYDTNKVEFSVKDNGVGISQEQQARLFTKFFRATNVMRMEADGTGLGLFITKNIIESHGGKIWCQSKELEGSTFSFSLPVQLNNK